MKNVLLHVPTMTLSESIIVFKRCAIVKTVHCLNFSRMVFWIRLSVLKECRNTVIHSILVVDILLFLLFINLWIAKSEAFNKKCTNCQWRHFINQICCIWPEVPYLGSTFAVASSIISMWFCLRMALARQISWRWPTLKLDPPSDTSESSCPGRSSTADFNWTWY